MWLVSCAASRSAVEAHHQRLQDATPAGHAVRMPGRGLHHPLTTALQQRVPRPLDAVLRGGSGLPGCGGDGAAGGRRRWRRRRRRRRQAAEAPSVASAVLALALATARRWSAGAAAAAAPASASRKERARAAARRASLSAPVVRRPSLTRLQLADAHAELGGERDVSAASAASTSARVHSFSSSPGRRLLASWPMVTSASAATVRSMPRRCRRPARARTGPAHVAVAVAAVAASAPPSSPPPPSPAGMRSSSARRKRAARQEGVKPAAPQALAALGQRCVGAGTMFLQHALEHALRLDEQHEPAPAHPRRRRRRARASPRRVPPTSSGHKAVQLRAPPGAASASSRSLACNSFSWVPPPPPPPPLPQPPPRECVERGAPLAFEGCAVRSAVRSTSAGSSHDGETPHSIASRSACEGVAPARPRRSGRAARCCCCCCCCCCATRAGRGRPVVATAMAPSTRACSSAPPPPARTATRRCRRWRRGTRTARRRGPRGR